jgi:DNA-binding transcriptional LysR family regulator
MDFDSLILFKTVVDEGGVIAAARKLHRVQSGVTTRIKQLEGTLGVTLFIRDKRRLRLSPAGEIFLGYVEQLLRLAEQARYAVHGDTPHGVLRLGTLESTAASRLPPLLAHYHQQYPAVRVELATDTTDALLEGVVRRTFDAAFVAGSTVPRGLEAMGTFAEELVLVAAQSHPVIGGAQDIRTDTVICFPLGCAYRRLLYAWLASGAVVPAKVLELSSYHAMIACVASGTGIALVPRSVLETVRVSESIAAYPLPETYAQSTTSLVWRQGEMSPALRALQGLLPLASPTQQSV